MATLIISLIIGMFFYYGNLRNGHSGQDRGITAAPAQNETAGDKPTVHKTEKKSAKESGKDKIYEEKYYGSIPHGLENGAIVKGVVLNKKDGKPVESVDVRLYSPENDFLVRNAPSIENGSFFYFGLPAGRFVISIDKTGYLPFSKIVEITAAEGTYDLGNLALERGGLVIGKIAFENQEDRRKLGHEKIYLRENGNTIETDWYDSYGLDIGGKDTLGRSIDGGLMTCLENDISFYVTGLSKGPAVVSISGKWVITEERRVEVNPDNMTDLGVVVLRSAPRITGTVVDESMQPVQGAYVTFRERILFGGFINEVDARTDNTGNFILPAQLSEHGSVGISTLGDKYVKREISGLSVRPGENVSLGQIVLVEAVAGTIRVYSESGAPITDASVEIEAPLPDRAYSHGDGSYKFNFPKGPLAVKCDAFGFEKKTIQDFYPEKNPELEIRLKPLPPSAVCCRISGRVEFSGEVDSFMISWMKRGERYWHSHRFDAKDLSFEIEIEEPGVYNLAASSDAFGECAAGAFKAENGCDIRGVVIRPSLGGKLIVEVTDDETGQPAAHIRIALEADCDSVTSSRAEYTRVDGSAEFINLYPCVWKISAGTLELELSGQYGHYGRDPERKSDKKYPKCSYGTVGIVQGETAKVNIKLKAGRTAGGKVIGPDGKPIEGVNFSQWNFPPGREFKVSTGPDGKFEFVNIGSEPMRFRAHFPARNGAPAFSMNYFIKEGDNSDAGLDIDFSNSGVLRGTVTMCGKPASGSVELNNPGNLVTLSSLYSTSLSESGEYFFPMVEPGEYQVEVSIADGDSFQWGDIVVETGKSVKYDIAIENALVKGIVTDENGAPVANVLMGLNAFESSRWYSGCVCHSAENGSFVLTACPPGKYYLSCHPDNKASYIRKIEVPPAGISDCRVILEKGHTVFLKVSDERGQVTSGVYCAYSFYVDNWFGMGDAGKQNNDGVFLMNNIPTGKVRIYACAPGCAPACVELDVKADIPDAAIALGKGATVEFAIMDSGRPPERCMVYITDTDGVLVPFLAQGEDECFTMACPDDDGKITVSSLAPGRYILIAGNWGSGVSRKFDFTIAGYSLQKFTFNIGAP
jgi:5-hydroxyisourate hydrolase-like protein (transthyretin family)